MQHLPHFDYEEKLWSKGYSCIGIDEVGRGAFAGPLVVAGVVFPLNLNITDKDYLLKLGINDSKKLTPKKREMLSQIIKENAQSFSISFIDVEKINAVGIGKATLLGMREVAQNLTKKISKSHLLIDAFTIPEYYNQTGIIRGDSISISIAAASIIAKVTRDAFMTEVSLSFPDYNWDKNKGYGTLNHRAAIQNHGLSRLHRTDFCRKIAISQ